MSDRANANPEFANWTVTLTEGTFEEVMDALEQVVQRLEEGQLPLDESVACYELGVRLAERSARLLDAAELRVSQLEVGANRADADEPAAAVGRD